MHCIPVFTQCNEFCDCKGKQKCSISKIEQQRVRLIQSNMEKQCCVEMCISTSQGRYGLVKTC